MFSHTPSGWLLIIGSILAFVLIIRIAVVPSSQPANEIATGQSEGLAMILFTVIFVGIVKWSQFNIFPNLVLFFGIPVHFTDQAIFVVGISLLVGAVGLIALTLAEALHTRAKSLSVLLFTRTESIPAKPATRRSS